MTPHFHKYFFLFALVCKGLLATDVAIAQAPAATAAAAQSDGDVSAWLLRLNEASRNRAYTGTFVVSAGSVMSSARIWHVCDGSQQLERVDALSGPPRTTVRRNDEVMTFVPEERLTLVERRESLGLFPAMLHSTDQRLADWYALRGVGAAERVAGFEADVWELQPRDGLRFGYRVWAEKKTGLVLKLQTLDAQQRVLEQVAFSELNLDASVRVDQLAKLMKPRPGYKVQQLSLPRSTAEALGWRLRQPVPGYASSAVHVLPAKRVEPASQGAGGKPPSGSMQWVFSDGLASVSLFVEPFDPKEHGAEVQLSAGATQSLARRLDAYWLTVVGEVPMGTLLRFSQVLERIP